MHWSHSQGLLRAYVIFQLIQQPFLLHLPQVFESVIPSERTRITVKIEEVSARLFAPRHVGAFVLHLGDVELATEMVGDSPEIRLRIAARALTALFTDNHVEAAQKSSNRSQPDVQGPLYWKACYELLIGTQH